MSQNYLLFISRFHDFVAWTTRLSVLYYNRVATEKITGRTEKRKDTKLFSRDSSVERRQHTLIPTFLRLIRIVTTYVFHWVGCANLIIQNFTSRKKMNNFQPNQSDQHCNTKIFFPTPLKLPPFLIMPGKCILKKCS